MLSTFECRRFLRGIPTDTIGGLRDHVLGAVMTYSFARVSAALAMIGKDAFPKVGRLWLRLHETSEQVREVPCHHNLEAYLTANVVETGIHANHDGPFVLSPKRDGSLSERRFNRHSAWEMLARRARAAGITTPVCNHSFRAIGITVCLENPEDCVEAAQYLAVYAKTETSMLYDQRD